MQPIINHLPLHIPKFRDDATGAADLEATEKLKPAEGLVALAIVIILVAVLLLAGFAILKFIAIHFY